MSRARVVTLVNCCEGPTPILFSPLLTTRRSRVLLCRGCFGRNRPPPPGAVETLTSMGFDEHDARRALGMCGNDLEAATDALLADVR